MATPIPTDAAVMDRYGTLSPAYVDFIAAASEQVALLTSAPAMTLASTTPGDADRAVAPPAGAPERHRGHSCPRVAVREPTRKCASVSGPRVADKVGHIPWREP